MEKSIVFNNGSHEIEYGVYYDGAIKGTFTVKELIKYLYENILLMTSVIELYTAGEVGIYLGNVNFIFGGIVPYNLSNDILEKEVKSIRRRCRSRSERVMIYEIEIDD